MTTVAIMQPTYLPWLGYFDLIDRASIFVFLDDVQFERRSWQQRNRIISKDEYLTISVPVQKKGKRGQLIKDVKSHYGNDVELYFGNGGDRTNETTPEIEYCEKNNIGLIWDLGGGKIQSSSDLLNNYEND